MLYPVRHVHMTAITAPVPSLSRLVKDSEMSMFWFLKSSQNTHLTKVEPESELFINKGLIR